MQPFKVGDIVFAMSGGDVGEVSSLYTSPVGRLMAVVDLGHSSLLYLSRDQLRTATPTEEILYRLTLCGEGCLDV